VFFRLSTWELWLIVAGVVGGFLAFGFGLTLAIGRYDTRRAAVVDDADTIGTTYLRAQTLAEPMRSRSLQLLRQYTDASLALSLAVPTIGDPPASYTGAPWSQ